MNQRTYCKCGATSMLNGRCIRCNRVRPSSEEVKEYIVENKKQYAELLKKLKKARKLEEKNENMC